MGSRLPEFEMLDIRIVKNTALAILLIAGSAGFANAADPMTYELSIKGKVFSPEEIKVKSGEAFRIKLNNENAIPVELESSVLGFEKVVGGNSSILVNVRAQKPGTYKFYDDFHPSDAIGHVVAE